MGTENCIFCKITGKVFPSYVLYEDDYFMVILDKFPGTQGHTLVVPKVHAENIYDLPNEYLEKLMPLVSKVAIALKDELNLEGLNILQNNGRIAGQTVFHFHMHLIPRYNEDGVMFSWNATEVDDAQTLGLIDKIKGRL